jgi:hypothetical protein
MDLPTPHRHGRDSRLIRLAAVTAARCPSSGTRPLFAGDMVTSGSFTAFTVECEATEQEQWRHVWGHIDQFRWRLNDLRIILLQVCASPHISRLNRSEALLGRKITLLCGRGGAMVAAIPKGESTHAP